MISKWKIGESTRLKLFATFFVTSCLGCYGQGVYQGQHYRTNISQVLVTNIEVQPCLNRLYYGIAPDGTISLLGTAYDHDEEMMENGLRNHQRKFLLILRSDVPIKNPAVLFQPEKRTPVDAQVVPSSPNPSVRPGIRPMPALPPLPTPRKTQAVVPPAIINLQVFDLTIDDLPYKVPYAFECQGGRFNGVFVRTQAVLHYFALSNHCYVTFTSNNLTTNSSLWKQFATYCVGQGDNAPSGSNVVNIPIGNEQSFYTLRSN